MLTLVIVLPIAVALVAGVIEYRFVRPPKPARGDAQDADREQRLSFLAESLAYLGALLVLIGAGIVTQQRWLHLTNSERVVILTAVTLALLLGGFAVRWLVYSQVHRLTETLWLGSVASAAASTATAMAGVTGHRAGETVLAVSAQLTVYTLILWFLCRRELLAVSIFAGLIGTLCSGITEASGGKAPWLAVALGLWLLGIAWAIIGVVYPQPLGTSVAAGAALALLAPGIAVHTHPWVYAVGIVTAVAVMASSVPLKNIVMLAFGSVALFSYITGTVFRFAERTLGVAEMLIIVGGVLICLAIVTVWLSRLTRSGDTVPGSHPANDGNRAAGVTDHGQAH
jgi:hypothetical protein